MNEIYIVDGKTYKVSPNNIQKFLQDFPNAIRAQDYKSAVSDTTLDIKPDIGPIELPQVDVTASKEEDTWIERTLGKNFATDWAGDIYRSFEQGLAQGATVDEAFDVYKKGKNISDEELYERYGYDKRPSYTTSYS